MFQRNSAIRLAAIAAGFLVPTLAAKLARGSAGKAFRLASKKEPPKNPASAEVPWRDAILWTLVSGVVGALARLLARRSLPLLGLPAEGHDLEDEKEALLD